MPKRGDINLEIAGIFYEMADILQVKNIQWKPAAYRMAAQTLESLREPISDVYKRDADKGIDALPGVGAGMTKKIIEYIKTGKITEHEKLKKSLPGEMYQIMKIPGIGPKKAILFYKKLGIKTVKELKEAARKGKLVGLPGFKQQAEKKILEGISIRKGQKGRIPLAIAEKIANKITRQLKKLPEVKEAITAGSVRRKKPTVRDLDIIVKSNSSSKVLGKFTKMGFVSKVLSRGSAKSMIVTKEGVQVDVRVFPPKQFGSGLLYFTGDKQHNIWLRKKAIKKKWKLNEYGLFEGKKQIAGKTEAEIYKKLGQKLIPPEKRIGEVR